MIAMPIIVKKPFSIEDIRSEGIKDINTKDFNDTNRVEQVHPEFEEKPVLPSTSQSSEETHGGSELTFSLSNSSQSNEHTANNQADQNNASSPNNADTNNDNAADNSDNKGAQEPQNAGGEKSNDNNEVGDNAVNTDVDK